jgi:hypothetical protein
MMLHYRDILSGYQLGGGRKARTRKTIFLVRAFLPPRNFSLRVPPPSYKPISFPTIMKSKYRIISHYHAPTLCLNALKSALLDRGEPESHLKIIIVNKVDLTLRRRHAVVYLFDTIRQCKLARTK